MWRCIYLPPARVGFQGFSTPRFWAYWSPKLSAFHGYEVFDSFAEIQEKDYKFDYVQLVEVIEHISDPIEDLCRIRQLMTPNALLFIATPLATPYSNSNNTYNVKSHLHFFTSASLNIALNKAGFSSLSRFNVDFPLYKNSASVYRENQPKELTKKIFRFIRSVILSRISKGKLDIYPISHISGVCSCLNSQWVLINKPREIVWKICCDSLY